MRVAVVDYGLANIKSVVNAVECFTAEVHVASRGEDLEGAEKIVLPGVGHFDEGMRGLRARGHEKTLDALVRGKGVPLLGICLGFQFLFSGSDEGTERGLGWIDGWIKRIAQDSNIKVPHMGWSEVECPRPSRLFAQVKPPLEFYFVHSYCLPNQGNAAECASALCTHGTCFVAALERDNIFATQFHPEKSQLAGMKLIETFLAIWTQMPKHRLIATLLIDSGHVVQTRCFKRTNMVGSAFTAVDFFNGWTVDEIIALEISPDGSQITRMSELVSELSRRCFVPLSVGGKIRDGELAARYLRAGADKVVLNTGAVRRPELITEIADRFGRQCVIVSIDAKPDASFPSGYRTVIDNARSETELDVVTWARDAVALGAGELMINSTTHDGNKQGYDLALTKRVASSVPVPVIAMGGVGKLTDFVDGIVIGGADAVAAGNIFHYFEHSTKRAKERMAAAGLSVRSIGFYKVNMPRRPKYRPF